MPCWITTGWKEIQYTSSTTSLILLLLPIQAGILWCSHPFIVNSRISYKYFAYWTLGLAPISSFPAFPSCLPSASFPQITYQILFLILSDTLALLSEKWEKGVIDSHICGVRSPQLFCTFKSKGPWPTPAGTGGLLLLHITLINWGVSSILERPCQFPSFCPTFPSILPFLPREVFNLKANLLKSCPFHLIFRSMHLFHRAMHLRITSMSLNLCGICNNGFNPVFFLMVNAHAGLSLGDIWAGEHRSILLQSKYLCVII